MPRRRRTRSLPTLLTSLGSASAQTIALRSAMMMSGSCSPAEYRRMVQEKQTAALQSAMRLSRMPLATPAALLAPWHSKAAANAKRLRRRKR